ncbi:Exodeoxyribonuclease I subunit D [Tindallia magadiensis]|uniref:Nuclease SbcCD subunit D n=1 Tax=Tindallia magadiensis TaxID=69895 RepID=A0A1I3CT69_9FIRM|nr:exonuclease SbcCD subunit D [Tindallia magadiensis]SFH77734.1 Exodeoxyribonuclease I subunit D [Tindallia magadiensis]
MRFIHTSDWHLGKVLREQSLLEDQKDMLGKLIGMIEKEKPDALVVAGDLYDQSVPSAEAIKLLDQTLHQIVVTLKTPVLAIVGNHDSAERVRFGNRLMKQVGYHVTGSLEEAFEPVVLQDQHGPVHLFLVPYLTPGHIRDYFEMEKNPSYAEAYQKIMEVIQQKKDPAVRSVLVTHAFVTPGGVKMEGTSESERPLPSVGGAEQVPAEIFDGFHYVALGHLHREMKVGKETLRYSGSPLKYSISEEGHQKGVTLVEMDKAGQVSVSKMPIEPRRDLRTVEGGFQELLRHEKSEDYVFLQLQDLEPVPDAMERIRTVYPNALHLGRKHARETGEIIGEAEAIGQKHPLQIITDFYEQVQGEKPDPLSQRIVEEVLESLIREEREDIL